MYTTLTAVVLDVKRGREKSESVWRGKMDE